MATLPACLRELQAVGHTHVFIPEVGDDPSTWVPIEPLLHLDFGQTFYLKGGCIVRRWSDIHGLEAGIVYVPVPLPEVREVEPTSSWERLLDDG